MPRPSDPCRFYLLDPSLRKVGGHYYEYALHVLSAAGAEGYRPVLAAHRDFDGRETLPPDWEVYGLYPHVAERDPLFLPRENLGDEIRETTPLLLDLRERLRAVSHRSRYRELRGGFLEATRTVFSRHPCSDGDHVFLATASGAALESLLDYFEESPSARVAQWHVQFHNNLFLGREPDYGSQAPRARRIRGTLSRAAVEAPGIRFYTTTEQLTGQYGSVARQTFQTLPYPVNAAFQTLGDHRGSPAPLTVTYVGDARREKGYQHLPQIVDDVWRDYAETAKIRFAIQSNFAFRPGRRSNLPVVQAREHLESLAGDSLEVLTEPLSTEGYRDLVLATDVGLLPYDPDRYYSRCSGVLVEMLSAGLPVIVPAGCWLGDQLAEVTHAHRDEQWSRLEQTSETVAAPTPTSVSVEGDDSAPRFRFPLSRPAIALRLRFRRSRPEGPGTYVRTRVIESDISGAVTRTRSWVEGGRAGATPVSVLAPLRPDTSEIRLDLSNPFSDRPVELVDVECEIAHGEAPPPPSGAVGLAFGDPAEIAVLLREMIDHYDHYRTGAGRFARGWVDFHNPRNVVARLLDDA